MTQTVERPMIFIATPCFGGLVSQIYMQSILDLTRSAPELGFDAALCLIGHDALITRCRATLVSHFLKTAQATHILFVDADIGFRPEQVAEMLRFDVDFVAGIYPLKAIDWSEAAVARAVGGSETFQSAPLLYVGSPCFGEALERRGRFAAASCCGGGFMLLKRNVIDRLIEAYPETRYENAFAFANTEPSVSYALFDCMIDAATKSYLSEDYAFCRRWRDIGGSIWLDTEGKLTHFGSHNFIGDPAHRVQKLL